MATSFSKMVDDVLTMPSRDITELTRQDLDAARDISARMMNYHRLMTSRMYHGVFSPEVKNDYQVVQVHQQPNVLRSNILDEMSHSMITMPSMIKAKMTLGNVLYNGSMPTVRNDALFFCSSYISDFEQLDINNRKTDSDAYMSRIVTSSLKPDLILDAVKSSNQGYIDIENLYLEVRNDVTIISFGKDTVVKPTTRCRCLACRRDERLYMQFDPGQPSSSNGISYIARRGVDGGIEITVSDI